MVTAVDSITGLIAPVVAAGVTMKVTDAMFSMVDKNMPKQPVQRKKKSVAKKTRKSSKKCSCKGKTGKSCKCKTPKKMHKGVKGQTALPKGHKKDSDLFQAVFGHPVIKG
jgi:hypothetical protein